MTDKEFRQERERIRKLIRKWHKPLGLDWWRIDYIYSRVSRNDESNTTYSPKIIGNEWVTVMNVSCDPYYAKAIVTCYLPEVINLNDEELEETYLHEMMHIFLSPLNTKQKAKEEEYVVTRLALAFIWIERRYRRGGDKKR